MRELQIERPGTTRGNNPGHKHVYPSIACPTWVMRLKRLYESVSGARNRSFVQYRPSKRFRPDFNERDSSMLMGRP